MGLVRHLSTMYSPLVRVGFSGRSNPMIDTMYLILTSPLIANLLCVGAILKFRLSNLAMKIKGSKLSMTCAGDSGGTLMGFFVCLLVCCCWL